MSSYDDSITHLEQQVEDFAKKVYVEREKLTKRSGDARGTRTTSSSSTDVEPAYLCPAPPQNTSVSIASEKLQDAEIDRQLGVFYGSTELRDAIKDAQCKMVLANRQLISVREMVHSPFVAAEIDHALKNTQLLEKLFLKMMDRMEIPDMESLLRDDDFSGGSSESRQSSNESLAGTK